MHDATDGYGVAYRLLVISLFFVCPASGQTWHADGVGPNLVTIGHDSGFECRVTLYDPENLIFPDGDFGFLSQGANPDAECPGVGALGQGGKDSIFTARFDSSTATWDSPSKTECPTVIGRYMSGDYPHNCGFSTNDPGPVSSPDIVEIGGRYFMAFGGGNADIIKGHVFLAFSDDGLTWNKFAWDPKPDGYNWRPIVYPYYGGPNDDDCYPFGIGQLSLVYEEEDISMGSHGTFYLYLHYIHGTEKRQSEMFAFRAPYKPNFNWGFGVNDMEICLTSSTDPSCNWVPHSGKLVWDYNNKPVVNGDPLLSRGDGIRMGAGGLDVVWDPDRSQWLHVYKHIGRGLVEWNTTSSLASGLWTTPQEVDLEPMHQELEASYPNYSRDELYPGVWYGTAGGRTGMWIRMPVDYAGCSGLFRGLGMSSVGFHFN